MVLRHPPLGCHPQIFALKSLCSNPTLATRYSVNSYTVDLIFRITMCGVCGQKYGPISGRTVERNSPIT
ncbi:hypothetical protein AQUCO_05400015v1 [Aquilegia coerulea]|uniref:Uncharacterized protein n=1 Tax=Aquilegia coerulea TaxID=218851 RepID=A0A2G5CH65_AQUCA|nr:hypothetical protein AQUCO_05400015v1 [Aquilegia coerulea]